MSSSRTLATGDGKYRTKFALNTSAVHAGFKPPAANRTWMATGRNGLRRPQGRRFFEKNSIKNIDHVNVA